jgi:hypothetical protein
VLAILGEWTSVVAVVSRRTRPYCD